MDINKHTTPENLEKYAFFWSEARLVVAAVALFLGGVPPIMLIAPRLGSFLGLFWIISGVVSVYLAFLWNKNGQKLFGGKDQKDMYAFWVNIISGINLGLTGLLGRNIGMSISSSKIVFIIVGIIYLASAWHLWMRWNAHGKKLF